MLRYLHGRFGISNIVSSNLVPCDVADETDFYDADEPEGECEPPNVECQLSACTTRGKDRL